MNTWSWKEIDFSTIDLSERVAADIPQFVAVRGTHTGSWAGFGKYMGLGLEQYPNLERDTQAVMDKLCTYGTIEFGRPCQPLNRVMEALFRDRMPMTDDPVRTFGSRSEMRVLFGSPWYTPIWNKQPPHLMVDRQYPREYVSPFLEGGLILTQIRAKETVLLIHNKDQAWQVIDHRLFANHQWRLGDELDCFRQYSGRLKVQRSK